MAAPRPTEWLNRLVEVVSEQSTQLGLHGFQLKEVDGRSRETKRLAQQIDKRMTIAENDLERLGKRLEESHGRRW